MRFGVVLPHFRDTVSPAAIRDVAQAAESLGFDSVWVTDRAAILPGDTDDRFGPSFYDPFVTLALVAGITSRVRLGASVFVLPFRHPVLTARALASLDQLSGGRLIVGVGAGWMAEEFAAIGVPFHQRGALTDEYLDAMRVLWTEQPASFDGPTVRFEHLIADPQPLQRPHPPIWVGGSSGAALRRTVRVGDAWHGSPQPLTVLKRAVAALAAEARRQGRNPAGIKLTTRAPLAFTAGAAGDRPSGADADDPAGTPDAVIGAIGRYQQAGFDELVFDTFFAHPALSSADRTPAGILATLDRFHQDVAPAFR